MTSRASAMVVVGCLLSVLMATPTSARPGEWITHGPWGNVTALAVDPTDPDTAYVAAGGGVFKTTGGGAWWRSHSRGLGPNLNINSLVIDPSDPLTLYAGTETGVYASSDGGEWWRAANEGLTSPFVFALAIDPAHPQTIYAGAAGAAGNIVFRSTDGARSWTNVSRDIPASYAQALVIDPVHPRVLYVGTLFEARVYKSTDRGETWKPSGRGIRYGESVSALAIDPSTPSTLYAGTERGSGLYKSTNGGASWFELPDGDPYAINDLHLDPEDPSVIYMGAPNLYKSTDGGLSWSTLLAPDGAGTRLALAPSHPATIYAGIVYGYAGSPQATLFKSTTAGSKWRPVVAGLSGAVTASVALDPSDAETVHVLGSNGFYTSFDRGMHWEVHTEGLQDFFDMVDLEVDPTDPETLYASACCLGGVFKSTDGGLTWVPSSSGLNLGVSDTAIDTVDPDRLYAASDGFYLSTDGAASWRRVGLVHKYLEQLAVDPLRPSVVWAGTHGTSTTEGELFRSIDRGHHWVNVLSLHLDQSVMDIEVDPTDSRNIYMGVIDFSAYNGYLVRSFDGGRTWAKISIDDAPVSDLVVDPLHPSTVYAGTRAQRGRYPGGVYVSLDRGSSWTRMSAGLTSSEVTDLRIDTSEQRLWVATARGGVFRFDL